MIGLITLEKGDTSRAINAFQTAVENDPDMVDGYLKLGELFATKGNSIAEQYYSNAVLADPSNIEALHAKAYYLSNVQNNLKGALQLYRDIVQLDPHYEEAFFNSGLLYLDMDQVEQAWEQFDLTVKASPTHIRGYYYRGLASELKGDKEAARNDYQQALKFYPDYDRAKAALARLNG